MCTSISAWSNHSRLPPTDPLRGNPRPQRLRRRRRLRRELLERLATGRGHAMPIAMLRDGWRWLEMVGTKCNQLQLGSLRIRFTFS